MESESSQQFCLRWHNHQSSVLGGLPALLDSGRLTDVTLCAGGRSLRAHRIVLSTCSPYFMDIFKELPPTQQPVVVILGGGWAELCCLVAFMYAGEVTLPRTLLPSLLRLARALRITGLTDLNGNIPDVPLQPEFDDSFNAKFESTFATYEDMRLARQNSDGSENASPFQKSFESHLAAKNVPEREPPSDEVTQENVYREIELLKQLSKHCISGEKSVPPREDVWGDGSAGVSTPGKKTIKPNRPKYLNPVLNELEPKNRKIDKIVENLKCNQMKTQEANLQISTPQGIDGQNSLMNVASGDSRGRSRKSSVQETNLTPTSKVADIFASNNIFMETDAENICDATLENFATDVKAEPDSSPEIIPDLKYVPLSPGMQAGNVYSSTNPKLFATCYVCHKRLSNQYNLRVHLETHQNARHACVACSHVSRSRDALRKHVSYRHPQLNISHSVGRPCKSSQNIQTTPSASQSSLNTINTSNLFNFSNVGATNDSNSVAAQKNNAKSVGNANNLQSCADLISVQMSPGGSGTDKNIENKKNIQL